MNKLTYVASWLVLTLLMGFTPGFAADETAAGPHADGGVAARPPADEDFLNTKKYNLLSKVFSETFSTKVKDIENNDKKVDEKELIRINASERSDIAKFIEMTKTFRVTLEACSLKKDDGADFFKKVMDKTKDFLISSFVADVDAETMKKDEDKLVEAKHFSTFIWAAEAYTKAIAKKHSNGEMDEWNKNYLVAAKDAFKALTKDAYDVKKWLAKRPAFEAAKTNQAEKDLGQMIADADTAIKQAPKSEEACLVKPKEDAPAETKPEVASTSTTTPTTPPATTASTSTTNTDKLPIGPGAPLQGNNTATDPNATASTSNTPGTQAPPLTDPNSNQAPPANLGDVADAGVNLDNVFRRLGDDFNNQAQQQLDDLNRQRQQLEDALAALDRANRDQQALLNDDQNNDAALADALRALGENNQEQPLIPPPITPPQIAAGDQGQGNEQPQFTPPPEPEQEPQQPFNPYAMGPQPLPPPTPIIVPAKDKDKENPFADLAQLNKQQLPTVSDNAAAVAAMKDLVAAQRDQIAMLRGGARPGGVQNVNSIASRMGQGGVASRGIPMGRTLGGNARSGQQGRMNNPSRGRTSTMPASMQARIR